MSNIKGTLGRDVKNLRNVELGSTEAREFIAMLSMRGYRVTVTPVR